MNATKSAKSKLHAKLGMDISINQLHFLKTKTPTPASSLKIADVNGPDTGNQSYKLATAINKFCKPNKSISFIANKNYLNFPHMVMKDPSWKTSTSWNGPRWIKDWFQSIDILHIHNTEKVLRVWPPYNPKATKILHQHARIGNPSDIVKSDRKNKTFRIVSTLNLLPWVENNPDRWLPAPMDIEWFDNLKSKYYQKHDTIRICQTATRLPVKRTDLFVSAMKEIIKKHTNVEMVLIQDTPWIECQKIKASCDILFDQILSYGTTALESWCFGYPVITGMSDSTYEIIEKVLGKDSIPFIRIEPSIQGIIKVLDELIVDEKLRKKMGAKGREYVEKWHSYPFVAKRAIKMYHEAMEK